MNFTNLSTESASLSGIAALALLLVSPVQAKVAVSEFQLFNPQTRLPYVQLGDISEGQLPKAMVMRVHPTVHADAAVNFIGMEDGIAFDIRGGSLIRRNASCGQVRDRNGDQF